MCFYRTNTLQYFNTIKCSISLSIVQYKLKCIILVGKKYNAKQFLLENKKRQYLLLILFKAL